MNVSQGLVKRWKDFTFFDRRDLQQIENLDQLVKDEGLPADTVQVRPIVQSQEALELPAPALPRPVLMVHGLAQKADNWVGFKNFFSGNPANAWGGIFRIGEEARFHQRASQNPRANLFAIDLSDNLASPRVMANEVRRAITAICKATGATQVDVITHSMGGLDAREAVRQGEGRIGKLVMLAPPSQGAFEANLAVKAFDSGAYQHYPPGHMTAMRDMQLEYGPAGGVGNPFLHDLNEWWKTAPNKPPTLVVTGVGLPTPDRRRIPSTAQGDGMVAARNAPVADGGFLVAIPNYASPTDPNFRDFQDFWYNHLAILNGPDVFREVADFLAGPGAPSPAPPPPPPASNFESYLIDVENRSGQIRLGMVEHEHARANASKLQKFGMWTSLVGSVAAAAGLAASITGHIGLGVSLLSGGALGLGVGTILQYVNRQRESESDRAAIRLGEEAVNMTQNLVHRVRTEVPGPAPAPPAPAPPAPAPTPPAPAPPVSAPPGPGAAVSGPLASGQSGPVQASVQVP